MSLDVHLTVSREVFSRNITHNLAKMAAEADLYKALWRPEELQIEDAQELVPILRKGLEKLQENPDFFRRFNPENGWGDYENLVEFVQDYLNCCEVFPNAAVSVDR